MPVINANCPADQATLKALYAHKAACLSRHKDAQAIEKDAQRIFAMKRLADRRAAVAELEAEQGEVYQENVKARLIALTEARKARKAQLKSNLSAAQARQEALECLEAA